MIKSEHEYIAISDRIEELLQNSDNIENRNSKGYIELNLLGDMVADYESRYHPITAPRLVEVLRLKMAELNLNQKKLAELLETSTSRISEYLNGKSEPTLKIARKMRDRLDIDADIILGR